MDVLIVYKWIFSTPEESNCAPSILIGVINMVLFTYSDTGDCAEQLFLDLKPLQIALVLIAVLSIPWLLLSKPLINYRAFQAKQRQQAAENGLLPGGSYDPPKLAVAEEEHDVEQGVAKPAPKAPAGGSSEGHHNEEEFDLTEEIIHQAIHTIEYCLGLVSHTASYLRLWALSLAHVELSQVLWDYLLKMALTMGATSFMGAAMTVPLFVGWATLTIGILVLMEGLSAFLHALRLHWVEFQSKFYGGEGYAFEPFTFNDVETEASN